MSNPRGDGEGIRKLMAELANIVASKNRIAEKERRMLHLAITFVGGDGGVLCWRSWAQGVKPGHQVCWPKSGRTDVPTVCLERVLATGKSIAPPDASGRAWADESPNGFGRVVVLPLMDDGRVAGAMGLHLNRAPVPCEEAAGVLRALATFFVALRGRAVRAPDAPVEERRMAGESAAILDVRAKIPKAALHDSNVLITGESGTGKELVARAVHEASPRGSGPFLAVNCAAMPETLLESTLYGHEEGAFSGAVRRHIGKIEQAQGGTLFLDEIGDTTLNGQAKLLRFLEERVFERVGGEETLRADVRVVAATNCDLRAMVERGEFRADLYYRLAVVKIAVPPLAERREDIPAIVAEILRRLEVRQDRKLSISAEAVAQLARRPWPGNIRELAHALEEAAVLHGPDLDATHFAGLPPESPGSAGTPKAAAPADVAPLQDLARPQGPEPKSAPTVAHPPLPPGLEPGSARGLVWQRACEVLRQTGYRICAAAKLIGWSRQWMRKYIDKFKLHDVLHFIRIRRPKAAET